MTKLKLTLLMGFMCALFAVDISAQIINDDEGAHVAAIEIGSWGGKVRKGPGMEFDQIASLSNGDVVHYLETSEVIMNGYPWIKIRFNGGQEGYKWGGILCGIKTPIEGLFETCTAPLKRFHATTNMSKLTHQEQIQACVDTEAKNNRNGEHCIGMLADPCMQDEEKFSTYDMRNCINTESKIWDARLNANYQAMREALTETAQKNVLRDMQRDWISYSQKICSLEYNLYKGTMYLVTGDYCMLEMRAKQSLELQSLIDTAELH